MRISRTGISHGTKTPNPIFSLDVSGTCVATASLDGEVGLWDEEYKPIKTIRKHEGAVLCVRFSADGSLLASGGDDGVVFVYKRSGDVVASMSEHTNDVSNVLWADKFLVSVGYDGNVVLYDAKSFEVVRKTKPHDGQIKGISADKSFEYMCTQGEDGIVLYKNFEAVQKIDASQGVILESFFSRMSWTPDGKFFASGLCFNRKCNTVEIFGRDLKNECSLIGHVAPCEAVAFSPRMYKRDRRYYVAAVASQDLSLSLWCSLSPKPFLLVKNLTELPVLDMRWSEDGTRLLVCSYGGEVVQISVAEGDLGEAYNEEEEDGEEGIFFSMENRGMFEKGKGMSLAGGGGKPLERKAKKVVRPVVISSDISDGDTGVKGVEVSTNHSYLAIFNYNNKSLISRTKCGQVSKVFGDFSIELDEGRSCVSVKRGPKEFYRIHGAMEVVCVSSRYLCLYTGRIQLYHFKTGVLAMPFIYAGDVVAMDVLGKKLLYLRADGEYTVLSIDRCRVCAKGVLPRTDGLLSLRLDKRYFLIAEFPGEECFLGRRSSVWFPKAPRHNSIWTSDTNLASGHDETLAHLENELLMSHMVKDKRRQSKALRRVTRAVCRMKKIPDSLDLKLKSIVRRLVADGEKALAIQVLEKMNTNYVLQPLVFAMLKEIGAA